MTIRTTSNPPRHDGKALAASAPTGAGKRPLLNRLLASRRGNVLPIMAASVLPMAAMVGGAIDMSRAYMVRSRIQQACDAGVLAGRRAMEQGTYTNANKQQARDFFDINFKAGYNDTTNLVFTTSSPAGSSKVVGAASTVMPTTIMSMFGKTTIDVAVNCEAELNLSNSDVTFVLDVTGSMAQTIPVGTGGSIVKLTALQQSVMSFYDTLSNAATGSNARVRYAFVPYSTNVNVGELLYDANPNWLVGGDTADQWDYQSRRAMYWAWNGLFWAQQPDQQPGASFAGWQYLQRSYPTYDFVRSIKPANPAVTTPSEINGSTSRWGGCIEERDTIPGSVIVNGPNGITVDGNTGAHDLNIDAVPTNTATKWRPYWEQVYFLRDGSRSTACPSKSTLLTAFSRTEVQNYVNNLIAVGGTYHDVGLLWGARISSPQGIFQSNVNAVPTNGGSISRHLIFMTDGILTSYDFVASMYGTEQLDRRVTGGSNNPTQLERQRRRYLAICEAIKSKGTRLWVIAFGTTLTADLQTCASSGSAFTAANSSSLNAAFENIAKQVAELRLTK